jgi:hypothetical protein
MEKMAIKNAPEGALFKLVHGEEVMKVSYYGLGRLGNDLLSHVLRRSIIGAKAFHGPVRDGMVCCALARATKSSKTIVYSKEFQHLQYASNAERLCCFDFAFRSINTARVNITQ